MSVRLVKYSLEIKSTTQKELDALDDGPFTRIDRKILALAREARVPEDARVRNRRADGRDQSRSV